MAAPRLAQTSSANRDHRATVAAGEAAEIEVWGCTPPFSIFVSPAAGATATIETSCSPRHHVRDGSGHWVEGPTVTEPSRLNLLSRETAIRLRAEGGAVEWEVLV